MRRKIVGYEETINALFTIRQTKNKIKLKGLIIYDHSKHYCQL